MGSTKRSTKATTPVSAASIRAAFRDGERGLDPHKVTVTKGDKEVAVSPACILGADGTGERVRGRLHPAFVAAYTAAFPEHTYAEKSVAEKRTVSLPLKSAKTGRPIKPVTVTVAEARALAGEPNGKGRLSASTLDKAAAAYQSR